MILSNINTKKYWDKEWSKRGERIYPYYELIVRLCGDKKVLDYGCGRGDLLQFLKNGQGYDISEVGVKICQGRGLSASTKVYGQYDIVVATEVLEHLDDDSLDKLFKIAPTVIYAVPNNCLGPEVEPEHQRVYTHEYIKSITPNLRRIWEIDNYLVVLAGDYELKPSILCAIPNIGNINVELANKLIEMSHDNRYELKIYYPQDRPIDQNRNLIAKKFVAGTWDYLIMIDSDNPPIRSPLDLIGLDLDVVACPTPQWNDTDGFPLYWVAMDKQKDGYTEHKTKTGLQEVDAVGTGCVIIARRVLEAVKAPFMRMWDEDGIAQLGMDLYFCEKAKEKGFKVFVHYDYPCNHYKELNLNKLWQT